MRRYKYIALSVALSVCLTTMASNSSGDAKYLKHDYTGAIVEYQKSLKDSTKTSEKAKKRVAYAKYRLGECHSFLNEPEEAVEYISDAILSGYDNAEAYLTYGKNLQKMGEYKRAKAAFDEYGRLNPGDKRTKNLQKSCEFAMRHSAKNPISPEQSLDGINTSGMEYGIGYYQNGLMYSTNTQTPKKVITNMYYTDSNDGYASSRPVDNMIKQKRGQNIGTFAIDSANNTLYYSRCLSNDEENYFIYKSVYDDKKGKWRSKGVLHIGNRHTNATHPALSPDGRRLYFTSNCKGGYGGTDIWYIEKKANGKWNRKPVNAGAIVNTPGNEAFPYIVENTLIFASDNQVGFGGYDLYSAQIDGAAISGVQNLMRPVNSSFDDINLIVSEKANEAFLVSSRNPQNKDDIYRFEGIFSSMMVSGHVYNKKTSEPIGDAQIIINGMGKSQTVTTDVDGYYYAFIEAGDFYKLMASATGYLSDISMIKTEKSTIGTFPVEEDFYLSQAAMSISGRVYDLETNEPFINEDVFLLKNGNVIQQTKTDITGRYLFTDLENGQEYQVKVNKPNFLTISSKPFIYTEGDGNNNNFDLASISYSKAAEKGYKSDETDGFQSGREIVINEIYYNFDSATLTAASKTSLDRIIMLLTSNPSLKLEFGSHTDLRGTDEYNLKLSEERAKSVVTYLVSNGISGARLSWKGYGKSKPIISNAVTEEEHRLNRRTTFKIIEN